MVLELTAIVVAFVVGLVVAFRGIHRLLLRNKRRQSDGNSMMDVTFLHPDLGLGGAERLIVDAATGLQKHQNVNRKLRVSIVTNFHDRQRAFRETVDGTLEVVVRAAWFPRSILGRALVLCATVRMVLAALITCLSAPRTDVFIVDQVSAAMPVLKLFCPASVVLFYCHFPDQLCDPSRTRAAQRSLLHRCYRTVFDRVEELTTNFADSIVCNSQFSRGVTVATFTRLVSRIHPTRDVFYPPISIAQITAERTSSAASKRGESGRAHNPFDNMPIDALRSLLDRCVCIVSINRYERKKNLPLALRGFANALRRIAAAADDSVAPEDVRLIVAGGYDERLEENKEHFVELQRIAEELGIAPQVVFLRSIDEQTKFALLSKARCVVYTPSGEHFGIVPIEAMAFRKPVVAVNDGGPLESVTEGDEFGFLRPADPEAFGAVMANLALNEDLCERVGNAARARCEKLFDLPSFSERLMRRLLELRRTVTDRQLGIQHDSTHAVANKSR